MLDKWVAVLTKYDLLNSKDLPPEIHFPEIKKALKVMQEMSLTADERDIYNSHLDFLRIEEGDYMKKFMEGKAEDIVEDEARGEAVGEKKKAIIISKKMLAEGFDSNIIAKITGLTVEEIKTLV